MSMHDHLQVTSSVYELAADASTVSSWKRAKLASIEANAGSFLLDIR